MTTTNSKFKLRLEIPSKHEIYYQKMGGGYSQPISGSVVLTSNTEVGIVGLDQLTICLIRAITTTTEQSVTDHEPFIGRLSRWITPNCKSKNNVDQSTRYCSMIEQLTMHVPHLDTDSQVGYSPEEGRIFKIPFHMPVPVNLPSTSATDLGQISYSIVAFSSSTSGGTPTASQEITLCQRTVPEYEPARYTRVYANSKIITKIIMTQNAAGVSKSNISAAAEVFVRQPTEPAGRPNEYKCVAIRGIQWRIEEVSKTFTQQDQDEGIHSESSPIEDRTSVREVAKGFQKGYWKTLQRPDSNEEPSHCDDFSVEIPLNITIPNIEKLAPEVDSRCYDTAFRPVDSSLLLPEQLLSTTSSRGAMLTIERRLKLDILTTEDTFDVCQHQLVDRKPLRTALNASFPLQIVDRAEGPMEELLSNGNPPRYEEVDSSPPRYNRPEH